VLTLAESLKLLAVSAIAIGGDLGHPAKAQIDTCLEQSRGTINQISAWTAVKDYFKHLTTNRTALERQQLMDLRQKIIEIETKKMELIDVVEDYIAGSANSGSGLGTEIRLRRIPDVLDEIQVALGSLDRIAENGSLFPAESAFKQLVVQLNLKRIATMCKLADATGSDAPDRSRVEALLTDLRNEVQAISEADDELGRYIAENFSQ
jgi:hypothetical protein